MADDPVTVGEDGVTPVGPSASTSYEWPADRPRLQVSKNTDGTWSWRRYNEKGQLVDSSGQKRVSSLSALKRVLLKGEVLEGVGDDEGG